MRKFAWILLVGLLAFTACKKNNPTPNNGAESGTETGVEGGGN